MKISEAIQWGKSELDKAGVERAMIDARLLLAHALQMASEEILMNDSRELLQSEQESFRSLIQRRVDREPYAYIVGEKEFFGLKLSVNSDVLIPRPETESLVEKFLEEIKSQKIESGRIIDLGTGSGAIALALTSQLSENFEIIGIDVSVRALECAEANKKKLGFKNIRFEHLDYLNQTDRLAQLSIHSEKPVLWIANPPYIPRIVFSQLEPEIRDFEPREALDGGDEGLDFYISILKTYEKISPNPRILAFETMGPWQIEKIRRLIGERKSIFTAGPLLFVK